MQNQLYLFKTSWLKLYCILVKHFYAIKTKYGLKKRNLISTLHTRYSYKKFGHDKIGLYRYDGLGCFQNLSGPESEKVKKELCKIFKQSGLNIAVECNLQITDFLDVTFDLRTDKYYPYRKDNNQLLYINKQSNHPPSIIKQIPSMVSRRCTRI